ncbi:MAG: hypothetical protein Q8932_09095 [Bacteroidota bacterium]|nr:hypothetical protein [Bacteroidota bacterium]
MGEDRFWKIVVHYANGKRHSGIRLFDARDAAEAKAKIWPIIHRKIGRWKVEYLDVRALDAEDPEVQAYRAKCIGEGKKVPGLLKPDK